MTDPSLDVAKQSLSEYHIDNLKNDGDGQRRAMHLQPSRGWILVGSVAAAAWLLDSVAATILWPSSISDAVLLQLPATAVYTRLAILLLATTTALFLFRSLAASQLDRALQRSSKWFSTTLKSIGAALIAVDKRGRVIFMNPVAQTLTGWRLEHAIDRPLANVCRLVRHGRDWDHDAVLERLIREGTPVTFDSDTRLQNADGFEPNVTGNANPIIDSEGEIIGSVFALHDITAAKQAEQTRIRLATVVDQADDAILIANTEGIVEYVNPSFEKVSGFTNDEIVGTHVNRFRSDVHDEQFFEAVGETLKLDRVWRGHLTLQRNDGTRRQLQSSITPIADADGNTIDYVSINHDITHEVELQQQLVQAQKMEAVGRLAGGIAHDFNNILTVIKGYVALIAGAIDKEDKVSRFVNELDKAGDSAVMLTQQLLAFSRKDALQATVANPNTTINDMSKMLRRLIAANVELNLVLDDDLGCVQVDCGQLGQAIMNLVVNASDAMPDGGKVDIRTLTTSLGTGEIAKLKAGSYVRIDVCDTGFGMDEATLQRIFEPFFTTKQVGKGTGLGLAMVYSFVHQMGGDIEAHSTPKKGTRFSIYLPTVDEIEVVAKKRPLANITGGHETILVVEDDPQILDLTSGVLESRGYTVLRACNGKEALDTFDKACRIDMMLTDIVMPHLNGFKLADQISKRQPELPILFMSGRIDDDSCRDRDISTLADSLLQKPFAPSKLLQRVRTTLDRAS
jgi:two-component system cell cycle sensor histidine kinase/response regulator CckA